MAVSELKLLDDVLQAKEHHWESQKVEWMSEIARLRDKVQIQKSMLTANLSQSRKGPKADGTAWALYSITMRELELENRQLKEDLGSLRRNVMDADLTTAPKTLMEQFEALQAEVKRRREECIKLHTGLIEHARLMKATPGSNSGPCVDFVNKDGELLSAFEEQKKVKKQLEDELKAKEHQWESQKAEWKAIIERLQEEVQLQKKILASNLCKSPQTYTVVNMQQNDITRLTFENSRLREKYKKAAENYKKANEQIEVLQNRLRETACVFPTTTHLSLNASTLMPEVICKKEPDFEKDISKFHEKVINVNMYNLINVLEKSDVKLEDIFSTTTHWWRNEDTLMPEVICTKEPVFEGMFEFRKEDINVIMLNLIIELKPHVASTLLPCLPAYILFMCVRHMDYTQDDDKIQAFFNSFYSAIKHVINRSDFECAVLWLNNTLRLLYNMKQYSGEKPFQLENTPRQNEQCLRNDLSEHRVDLDCVALWIYNNIIEQLRERLQPFVVPALLEHKAIVELNCRPRGTIEDTASASTDASLSLLLEHLTTVHRTLQYHGVDPEIVVQIFKQLFYFVCASALNNLLLRSELCHWSKGIQLRYNLRRLKDWAADMQMVPAIESLEPIVQAAQLLHTRKSDIYVDSICKTCNKLTGNQIIRILNMYMSANEFGGVSVSFIKQVQEKLEEREEKNEGLLMDLRRTFPLRFLFNPSNVQLEDIEVPEVLNLPMLKKV